MEDLTKNSASWLSSKMLWRSWKPWGSNAIPNDLPGYGASVLLHVGEDDMAVSAAYVAGLRGGELPHLADEKARKGFAREVAEFVVATRNFDADSSSS